MASHISVENNQSEEFQNMKDELTKLKCQLVSVNAKTVQIDDELCKQRSQSDKLKEEVTLQKFIIEELETKLEEETTKSSTLESKLKEYALKQAYLIDENQKTRQEISRLAEELQIIKDCHCEKK